VREQALRKAKTARRQRPGRPEGPSQGREQILDAAEEAFADLGYAKTSLREIVNRANLTSALATYYFGSKEKLFEEVFLRRALPIAKERLVRLSELKKAKGKSATVQDLINIYLAPLLKMPRTRATRNFLRIHARLHMEPEEFALDLRRRAYNEMTRAYAKALNQVLPHMPLKTIYWRLILQVGAILYAMSDTHRIDELSEGRCNPENIEELVAHITDFVCGGMTAPARSEQASDFVGRKRTRAPEEVAS
jgi:AcrR family transcriptional regulator